LTSLACCPGDLSDARRRLIGLTLATWQAELRGNGLDMDVILDVACTGLLRRYLPHDFAP
jgi:hypothetical protein